MKKFRNTLSVLIAAVMIFILAVPSFASAATLSEAAEIYKRIPSEQAVTEDRVSEEKPEEEAADLEAPSGEEIPAPDSSEPETEEDTAAEEEAEEETVPQADPGEGSPKEQPDDETVSLLGTNNKSGEVQQKVIVDVTDDHLTLIVRGITPEDQEKLVATIEERIEMCIENDQSLKVVLPNLTDAEKYGLYGYDGLLCWAATAANMLWTSNYAQQAVNPFTDEKFSSVDEVFDYFRLAFTDESGRPDGAISVFFTGDYPFTGAIGWSQLLDPYTEGLLPKEEPEVDYGAYNMDYKVGDIELLEYLSDYAMGVLLHSIDNLNGNPRYGSLAHWVTVAGLIYDENKANLEERYKSILIADSDNDKEYGPAFLSFDEMAEKAAQADNSYTIYPLTLRDYGNRIGKRWTIPFWKDSDSDVVLDWFAFLSDTEAKPEEPSEPEVLPQYAMQNIRYNGTAASGKLVQTAPGKPNAGPTSVRVTFFVTGNYYMATVCEIAPDGTFSVEGVGPIEYISLVAYGEDNVMYASGDIMVAR